MKSIHHLLTVIATVSLIALSSCNQQEQSSNEHVSNDFMMEADASGQVKLKQVATPENRKLIWTADLEFQVKNVNVSTEKVSALSEKYQGFVSNMMLSNNAYRLSNTITVRVPNKHFQQFISAIKGEALFIERADIASEDVTEEYVDIEARLKTKREVRDRYIEVLKTKTGSVKDIIEAEEAIRVITEEIEAKEGRLRYLNDRIDLSTVTITMYEKVKYVDSPERFEKSYSDEVGESFGTGWQAVKIILLGFIAVWPLLLIGLIALVIWKRKKIMGWFGKK